MSAHSKGEFVADLAIERGDAPPNRRWIKIGALWVGADGQAKVCLYAFALHPFAGKLNKGLAPVYVAGDLIADIPTASKLVRQCVGHIQTASANEGSCTYFGLIYALPVGLKATEGRIWLHVTE